ncbi:hypothetical protein B0F90DRAFT_833225 [Multifurca ochricompacta]|uniref:Protein kinase domain-containing protein n=1 Tax=Multifurca ochricompacta TaxID=376703 RepID=A0AAD4QM73_9AGAM|nr:hypothetical protein B0F90DRAFT_833225 [Multifurca ochricompacta]
MGSHSPASTNSTESWDSDLQEENGFGYPLQRMVPLESMRAGGGEESPHLRGLYRIPSSQSSSTSSHMVFVDFEAVVDEYLSHYTITDAQDLVVVEADSGTPSGTSTSLILRRVNRHSPELAILQALNLDEIRNDPWNPAPRLLYTVERGDDVILCIERLFDCDDPPLQTVANVVDFIRQALEGLCFLHEHNVAHHAYDDPNGVMMDIGRRNTAGFDRTRLPVRYYRINFSQAQQLLPSEADPRNASFCSDVLDCGSMLQTLVEEVPKIGGKLRSLVAAMTSGEYGAEDARKLFEALCKGIDASTYDAPLQPLNMSEP